VPIPQQRQCVLGNHEFISRHDVDRDLAIRARDPPRVTGVLGRVERHPEPLEPLGKPCPNADRIFTMPAVRRSRRQLVLTCRLTEEAARAS
jgi:hypothetical protein